jgi:hypothetical protein
MRDAQLELTPLERTGRADEVAHVVAFLLWDATAYVSGAEIAVDGGFTSSAGVKYSADRIAAAHTMGRLTSGPPHRAGGSANGCCLPARALHHGDQDPDDGCRDAHSPHRDGECTGRCNERAHQTRGEELTEDEG